MNGIVPIASILVDRERKGGVPMIDHPTTPCVRLDDHTKQKAHADPKHRVRVSRSLVRQQPLDRLQRRTFL